MRNSNAFLDALFGGWELNLIQTLESGIPFSFTFAGSPNVYLPMALRPEMAPGKTHDDIRLDWDSKGPCRHQRACQQPWANINAFAHPASFTPGTSGRNTLSGPGMLWHQASIAKNFMFGERLKGTLRYDIRWCATAS